MALYAPVSINVGMHAITYQSPINSFKLTSATGLTGGRFWLEQPPMSEVKSPTNKQIILFFILAVFLLSLQKRVCCQTRHLGKPTQSRNLGGLSVMACAAFYPSQYASYNRYMLIKALHIVPIVLVQYYFIVRIKA